MAKHVGVMSIIAEVSALDNYVHRDSVYEVLNTLIAAQTGYLSYNAHEVEGAKEMLMEILGEDGSE